MQASHTFAVECPPPKSLVCRKDLGRGGTLSLPRCSEGCLSPLTSAPGTWRVYIPPDYTALVLLVFLHVEVAVVGNGKDMRRHLTHMAAVVQLHLLQGIEGQHLERVHGHQDGACVCLEKAAGSVPLHSEGQHCLALTLPLGAAPCELQEQLTLAGKGV